MRTTAHMGTVGKRTPPPTVRLAQCSTNTHASNNSNTARMLPCRTAHGLPLCIPSRPSHAGKLGGAPRTISTHMPAPLPSRCSHPRPSRATPSRALAHPLTHTRHPTRSKTPFTPPIHTKEETCGDAPAKDAFIWPMSFAPECQTSLLRPSGGGGGSKSRSRETRRLAVTSRPRPPQPGRPPRMRTRRLFLLAQKLPAAVSAATSRSQSPQRRRSSSRGDV